MSAFLAYSVIGIFTGAAYAIAASGLVLTYSTTRVFNVAHGAVGMLFAFGFWDLSQRQGMPAWLALVLILGVIAPAFGILMQRVLVRDLGNAPIGVSLVVTVGLLVALIGVATQIWPPAPRTVPEFFAGHVIHLGADVTMTWHQALTVITSVVIAGALYVLLTRTNVGFAMRASVDDPELLRLYGGKPELVASLSWAIGSSLAALSGILLAPVVGLQYYDLTLLVISAYAAAMLGKLTNLPMAFAGAMVLGLAQSYVIGYLEYIPFGDSIPGLSAVIPTLFLFAILVLLPGAPLRIGQVKGLVSAPVPSLPKAGIWGGALVVGVALLVTGISEANVLLVGTAIAYAIIMLSLVVLTGYGGFVSLAQFTFAGVGAVAYCRLDQPNVFGLVVVTVIAAVVGAIVALPVLRLTGLYLALATLAFGQLMDKTFFASSQAFEGGNVLQARRVELLGIRLSSTGAYTVMMVVVLVVLAIGVIAVRRGRVGRMLIALRDSQAACGTIGLDHRWLRVGVFAASAGMAGLGGALLASLRGSASAPDFVYFQSLIVLLMAVVWGVTSVTGAVLGGVFLMYLPQAQADHPDVAGLLFVLLGLGAVLLARDPNGLANKLFGLPRWVQNTVYPSLVARYPGMALGVREPQADDAETADNETYEGVNSDAVAAR